MAQRKKGNSPDQPFDKPIERPAPRVPSPPEMRQGHRVEITAAQIDGPTSYGRLWEVTCKAKPEIPPIVIEAHDATEAVRAIRLLRKRDYGDFSVQVERLNPEIDQPAKPAEPVKTDNVVIGSRKSETISSKA